MKDYLVLSIATEFSSSSVSIEKRSGNKNLRDFNVAICCFMANFTKLKRHKKNVSLADQFTIIGKTI